MTGTFVRWIGLGCAAPGLLTVWVPDALLESWVGPAYFLWLFASGNGAWAALEALRANRGSTGSAEIPQPGCVLQEGKGSIQERIWGVGWARWWALVAGTLVVSMVVGVSRTWIDVEGRPIGAAWAMCLCLGVVSLAGLWGLGWNVERRGRGEG